MITLQKEKIPCPCGSTRTQSWGSYTRKDGMIVPKRKCTVCGAVFSPRA